MIALAARGRLELIDLATCSAGVLARANASEVRFSPDGRWLAYSRLVGGGPVGPLVIPVSGGASSQPLGTDIVAWSWAPKRDVLYGVNGHGQLVAGSPDRRPLILASGLGERYAWRPTAAPSPNSRRIAVNRSRCGTSPQSELDTVAVPSGARRVVLRQPGRQATFAGWSPNGRLLLYWASGYCSSSVAADGGPLKAVPAGGGRPVTAVSHMLLYPDFLSWCGKELIGAAGPDRETQTGSALVETAPPGWRQRAIEPARKLSWVSPSCAPSGLLLAAAAGPDNAPVSFGLEHRSIWLLRPDGAVVRRLTSPPARTLSDEAPRFSRNARWILFVQSRVVTPGYNAARGEFPQPISRDTIELVPTAGGRPVPIIEFTGNDFSYYDHFAWDSEIDWSQTG
jgi:hypothetical protein